MIEITSENVWYKKKKRKFKLKRFVSWLIVIISFISLICYYKRVVCVRVNNICLEYAYSYSTDSVNKAVLFSLNNSLKYEDLIAIEKNSNGDIIFMGANSLKINSLSKEIALETQKILTNKMSDGIPIHFMTLLGFNLLSGYGREIKLKTVNVSSVKSEFQSKFTSVGINQTLHSIYVLVNTEIVLDMPLKKEKRECKTSVLISENLLVGKVPEIYLGGKLFT